MPLVLVLLVLVPPLLVLVVPLLLVVLLVLVPPLLVLVVPLLLVVLLVLVPPLLVLVVPLLLVVLLVLVVLPLVDDDVLPLVVGLPPDVPLLPLPAPPAEVAPLGVFVTGTFSSSPLQPMFVVATTKPIAPTAITAAALFSPHDLMTCMQRQPQRPRHT